MVYLLLLSFRKALCTLQVSSPSIPLSSPSPKRTFFSDRPAVFRGARALKESEQAARGTPTRPLPTSAAQLAARIAPLAVPTPAVRTGACAPGTTFPKVQRKPSAALDPHRDHNKRFCSSSHFFALRIALSLPPHWSNFNPLHCPWISQREVQRAEMLACLSGKGNPIGEEPTGRWGKR